MIIDERIFSKLTDEQKKAVEAAQSPEELLAFAKETGYELTDEQLSAVSEGSCASLSARDTVRPSAGRTVPIRTACATGSAPICASGISESWNKGGKYHVCQLG